jgi:prepilin-type N-terminal cleavage/methylation domain-containing protein
LRHPTSGNTERGFTLVEVLVALAAMAIGFIVLWGMHFASLRMQSGDQLRADAVRLAQAALESQRNSNATYPGSNATLSQICNNAIYTGNDTARFDNCTVRINWPQSWQRQVTATASWKERISLTGGGGAANKRTQSVQLSTIYIVH